MVMVTDPRQILRLGAGCFEVDSVFMKFHSRVRKRCTLPADFFLRKAELTSKNPSPERRISRKTAVNCPERVVGGGAQGVIFESVQLWNMVQHRGAGIDP